MHRVKHFIGRFFILVIALQILNMSIDAPAAQMNVANGESDSFNYIDTFVEYIAEVVLKYDNAIPENQNREHKELQYNKYTEYIVQRYESAVNFMWTENLVNRPRHLSDEYAYQFVNEINPPPPKA